MGRGDYVYLYCFLDNALVGGCGIVRNVRARTRKRHVSVFDLAVSREARGQGIGYQLAHTTIVEAQRMLPGLRLLVLDVYAPNRPAIQLYHKLGFEEAGRIRHGVWYQDQYIDEVEMTRPL